MKKVVFLVGVLDRNFSRTKNQISHEDYDIINNVAEKLGVEATIMIAVRDPKLAGKAKDVKMSDMRTFRESTLADIRNVEPDVVVACGPVALKCLLNKGNVPLKEHLREDIAVQDLPGTLCVVTHSLEQIAAKPGMDKWLMLDVHAALNGRTETTWGKYKILLPGNKDWAVMPEELIGCKEIGLDLETYPGLNPWHPDARIRMAVVSHKVGRAWIVQAKKNSALPAWLRKLIEDPSVMCGGSNIKYDYKWLQRFGYDLTNMFDTSTAEHVLDCTNPLTDLKSLTFLYVPKLGDYSRANRKLVEERGGWEFVSDAEQYQYCGGDGEASVGAMKGQLKKLKAEGLTRPYALSMGLYRVLAGMEARGACISTAVNDELNTEFERGLASLRAELTSVLGPINPNSPDQLADALLANVPGIDLRKPNLVRQMADTPYRLRTDATDDDFSTDKAVLERESEKHPVLATLLQYRRYSKLHGTYVTGLKDKHMVLHPDGNTYVHTSYRTDVVETYRLSSQGPNLQNIPRKPEPDEPNPIPLHLNIKRQFVSRFEGGSILEGDLSQAEIRVAADLSLDEVMISAILTGEDLHRALCAKFHSKTLEEVTKLERTMFKPVTFLVIYGGGANTLSRKLGVSKQTAKQMLDQYFDTFPQLKQYIDRVKMNVKRDLYSESIFGYRRRFRKPPSWEQWEGWKVERQAWNHQVQNGAAGIAFVAMMNLEESLRLLKLRSQIVMQVHDSIVVDCYPGEEDVVARATKYSLEHPNLDPWGVVLHVPLVADIEIGPNWGDKKPFDFGS
jgi:DNA polymerase-1